MIKQEVEFYINKDKLILLENYGFIRNDSPLWERFLYINKCGTMQNRIFIYKDLRVRFGSYSNKVLNVFYDMIKDDIVRKSVK